MSSTCIDARTDMSGNGLSRPVEGSREVLNGKTDIESMLAKRLPFSVGAEYITALRKM